jgi:hypothetical protein
LMKVGQLRGAGIVSTTSDTTYYAFAAEAGYLAQAQAPGRQEMQSFIAASAADVDARVGHMWQNMNRSVEYIPVSVLGVRDVIDPALMEWHKLNVGTYIPLEKEAFGTTRRVLPLAVSRSYTMTPAGVVKRVTAQFEPETKGRPAIRVKQLGTSTMEPGAVLGEVIEPTPPEPEEPPTPCDVINPGGYTKVIDFCFREQDYGLIPATLSLQNPHWVSGEGWKTGRHVVSFVHYRTVILTWPSAWANQVLNSAKIEISYTVTPGTTFGSETDYGQLTAAGGIVTLWNDNRTAVHGQSMETISGTFNMGPGDLSIAIRSGQAFDADPGGEVTLHRFTVYHNEATDPYTI